MVNDLRQRAAEDESKTGANRPPMYYVIANSNIEFVDKHHAPFPGLLDDSIRCGRHQCARSNSCCRARSWRSRTLEWSVAD